LGPRLSRTTNILTTGFNGIERFLLKKYTASSCKGRLVNSSRGQLVKGRLVNSTDILEATSLGETQALENAWTATAEYTARAAAGKKKVRQSAAKAKRKREEKAALLP
jgi:deoxycytidylate deaminase